MPLSISVSNVASLIGQHQYTTANEALLAYLKKRNGHTYYTSLHRLGHTLDKEDAVVQLKRHLKATMPAYTTLCRHAIEDDDQTDAMITLLQDSVMHLKPDTMDSRTLEQVKKDLQRDIQSSIWKQKGNAREKEGLDTHEEKHRVRLTRRNDTLYKKTFSTSKGNTYTLRGKIDGYDEETDTVVDMKNRANRFFKKLPDYEACQLRCYMDMLGASKGQLIQRYRGKVQTLATLDSDLEAWKEIRDQLDDFVDFYCAFVKDNAAVDAFVLAHGVYTVLEDDVPRQRKKTKRVK